MRSARTLIGAPYRLARLPLTIFDQRVAHRLPDDSGARLMFDRALGTYDYLAGRLIADPEVARRGSDRMARVAALAEAAELEQRAAATRAAADDAARTGAQQATSRRTQARDRARQGVQDAGRTEREGTERAEARARDVAAERKRAAEARKRQRVAAAEQGKDAVEDAAGRRLSKAQHKAKGELADAARTREEAAADRADADQLAGLTADKRRARKQS